MLLSDASRHASCSHSEGASLPPAQTGGGLPAAAGGLVNPPGAGVREGGALAAAEIARR